MIKSFPEFIYKPLFVFIGAVFMVLVSCGKQEIVEPKEQILVRIGDKTIAVNEFIRRAEYTVRPP